MFGSEQALGEVSSRGRFYYKVFGYDHMGHRVRAMHLRKMLAYFQDPQVILDAGCGNGSISFWLARRYPQAGISAVDVDERLVEHCNRIRGRLGWTNLQFMCCDLVEYEPTTRFDLICCVDVLEHIEDDEEVLRNLHCILKDKGALILHVPRSPQLHKRYCGRFPLPGLTRDHVREGYTEEEIMGKLASAGFVVQEKRHTFGRFGAMSRELFYGLDLATVSMGPALRSVFKGVSFPLLISLAYLDTLTFDEDYQGFLFWASKAQRKEAECGLTSCT